MGGLLAPPEEPGRGLRARLESGEVVIAPGAYDALSARLVEVAGFDAVYMTGFGTAASLLGCPDVGLLTMSEMVDHARRLAQAVTIPLIADADTGYGNPLNVVRTVRAYEQAGVAAIQLEDQVFPKRCGHLRGKDVIPPAEMVTKLRAAVETRRCKQLVVIARTDAIAVEGLGAAIDRAGQYHQAGADVLFIEAPRSEDDIARIGTAFPGVPLLFNWIESGQTPLLSLTRVVELGFRLVLFPVTTLLAAAVALQRTLSALRHSGPGATGMDPGSFKWFLEVVGLPEIWALEQRFAAKPFGE
jgi:2-methylisocitrate lyase-like PEP mutase family enzyme